MEQKKGIFSALDLAKYICYMYYAEYKKEISPIKLQKSLYFCFAYWGGFVRKNNKNEDYVEEKISLSEYLFNEKFKAWVYGPVIPDIFRKYKDNKINYKNLDFNSIFDEENLTVREAVDSLLNELFEVSDFKLVSISHEDECWKNHFDIFAEEHNQDIPPEEIINEYAFRKTV